MCIFTSRVSFASEYQISFRRDKLLGNWDQFSATIFLSEQLADRQRRAHNHRHKPKAEQEPSNDLIFVLECLPPTNRPRLELQVTSGWQHESKESCGETSGELQHKPEISQHQSQGERAQEPHQRDRHVHHCSPAAATNQPCSEQAHQVAIWWHTHTSLPAQNNERKQWRTTKNSIGYVRNIVIARQKRHTLIAVSSGEKFESKFAFVSFWKAAYPVLDNVMQAVRAKPIEMLVTISHLHAVPRQPTSPFLSISLAPSLTSLASLASLTSILMHLTRAGGYTVW